MAKYRTDWDYCSFCAEYAHETASGAIKFSLSAVKVFIEAYTNLKYEDFTPEMIKRLRMTMVDYYDAGVKSFSEGGAEKIELPDFIFR